MKNKVMKKILMIMLSSTILMGSASVTAFAQANENAEQTEAVEQVIEEQPAEQPTTEETPFSTPGNGQLVDDKENDSSKQFLTVQTKNGNTFYMVIDRSGTSENVYMMSLVDENDLAEFLDENEETEKKEESAVVLPETTAAPEPETTVQPETEVNPESGGNKMFGSAILGGGIVLVFGGLAAFVLSKFRKKKEDGIVEEEAFRKYCVKDKKPDEPDHKTELPEGYEEGMTLASVKAEKSTHYTSPPKMFTEDTLLAAMETAGNKEFDSETEKKGLGTPATRANIIEKLVSSGYAERKGKQILPTVAGCELIHVMPENLKSAGLTAEWENQLLMMEKGEIQEDEFMNGIVSMINEILSMCRAISEEERNRFQIAKEVIGKCPVCGSDVYEGKTNYYCSDRSCQFALWKSNRFLESMKKSMDKKMAVELLKNGRTHVKGLYSKKKDSKFDADLVLGLEDGKARFSLEFPKKKK